MKQYIKKALWIIPFVFSLNLSGQDYFYNGTGTLSSPGSSANTNFYTQPGGAGTQAPANFLEVLPSSATTVTIDLEGQVVNFAGRSMINVTFLDGTVFNNGTITITSLAPPTLGTGASTNFTNTTNTVTYSRSLTGTQEIMGADYYNLTLISTTTGVTSNAFKLISAPVSISGALTVEFAKTQRVTISSSLSFAQNTSSISLKTTGTGFSQSNYTFQFENNGRLVSDNRTTKSFPGRWNYYSYTYTNIYRGTYFRMGLDISYYINNVGTPVDYILNGDVEVTDNLYNADLYGFGNDNILNLNNYLLTVKTVTNPVVYLKFRGSSSSSIHFNGTASTGSPFSVLIDSASTYDNFFKNITLSSNAKVSLTSNVFIAPGTQYGTLTVNSGSSFYTYDYNNSGTDLFPIPKSQR